MEHAPLPLYALFSRRRPIDRALTRLMWKRMRSPKRKLGFLLGSLAWPVRGAYLAARLTISRNREFGQELPKTALRQWFDQLVLAGYYGRPPHIYYRYALYNQSSMRAGVDFLTPQEFRGVVDVSCDTATYDMFRDKSQFEAACQAHGLSSVGKARRIQGSVLTHANGTPASDLPHKDLFIKPEDGMGGVGTQAWVYRGGMFTSLSEARSLSPTDLLTELRALSRSSAYLIQPLLRNADEIKNALGDTALATVRVFTIKPPGSEPTIAYALFKVPAPNAIVDNIGSGGIGCPVDLDHGRLLPGFSRKTLGSIRMHPLTKRPFEDVVLPHFPALKELAVRAHSELGNLMFAGWDIAILNQGPTLVEGNTFPSIESVQQAFGPMLGDQGLVKLITWSAMA